MCIRDRSYAISFRVAVSFEEDGLRSCMYITDHTRRECESGSESVTAGDQYKPTFFNPAFFMFAAGVGWYVATSSIKSNCTGKPLLGPIHLMD